jgi:hypothetical protein
MAIPRQERDNFDITVPVVSPKPGLLYCAHQENGNYQYVGLDWKASELKDRWIFPMSVACGTPSAISRQFSKIATS